MTTKKRFVGRENSFHFSFRIGSDEEDNDSDQEENKDSELETAVSRQETNVQSNENPTATELHSNGHEYIFVDRSANRDVNGDVQPAPILDEPEAAANDNDNGE